MSQSGTRFLDCFLASLSLPFIVFAVAGSILITEGCNSILCKSFKYEERSVTEVGVSFSNKYDGIWVPYVRFGICGFAFNEHDIDNQFPTEHDAIVTVQQLYPNGSVWGVAIKYDGKTLAVKKKTDCAPVKGKLENFIISGIVLLVLCGVIIILLICCLCNIYNPSCSSCSSYPRVNKHVDVPAPHQQRQQTAVIIVP